ncbi:FGGY-family carbohydrate kinase [Arthrobacter sp. HLT1-21]
MADVVLGVDIGTGSSKGVLVAMDGTVRRTKVIEHRVERPYPGWVEMDAHIWWDEFTAICRALLLDSVNADSPDTVVAVGVSGMGPCVLLTDDHDQPLRPAILYGVDTRATAQISVLTSELGGDQAILDRCGSVLSTQAVGPKLAWIAEHEPTVLGRARKLFMPSSWLAFKLTGEYVLDHHSASQSTPLYDTNLLDWYHPWSQHIAPDLQLPRLIWPSGIAGTVSTGAARETGLPPGVPVIAGTIDAWTEAVSVDAQNDGDLMLMYGSTMFLVHTVPGKVFTPNLWGTIGAFEGTRSLAGGMATSGAITGWLKELFGSVDYPELLAEAERSGPGAGGLVMLPYFAGERTPIADPDARGLIAGLTLSHGRGDLYRAALEATALGVRHNIEQIEAAGGAIERIIAVGGGTQGDLWMQIVSDITGLPQVVPTNTIGASYGAAYFAALATGNSHVDIRSWNPTARVIVPNPAVRDNYDELYSLYRDLYPATREITHHLAQRQHLLFRD